MNIIHASQSVLTLVNPSTDERLQIYRESRGGNFVPGFSTDSDAQIIEASMFHAPAYDGGETRVMDQSDQRKIARTEIGLPVRHRANVFQDWHFALIACDLLKQKKIRDAVEMRF